MGRCAAGCPLKARSYALTVAIGYGSNVFEFPLKMPTVTDHRSYSDLLKEGQALWGHNQKWNQVKNNNNVPHQEMVWFLETCKIRHWCIQRKVGLRKSCALSCAWLCGYRGCCASMKMWAWIQERTWKSGGVLLESWGREAETRGSLGLAEPGSFGFCERQCLQTQGEKQ